jgi:hypothetical protein
MKNHKQQSRKIKMLCKRVFVIGTIIGLTSLFIGAYVFLTHFFQKTTYLSPLGSAVLGQQDVDIKRLLVQKNIPVKDVISSGGVYLIHLQNDAEVLLSSDKDLTLQISSLQFILSRLTMEGKVFSQLDLRFDKPVIRE